MSTQPVYGNNGYKNVQTSAGANVQYLNADTVNVSNLNVAETVSFFGASPTGQQTLPGSPALADVIAVLRNLGLVN